MKQNFIVLLLLFTSLWQVKAARTYAGGDISLLPLYEQIQSKYYDYDGNPIDDVVKFYADEGMNLMRVRLMVNPSAFPGSNSYGGNPQWLGYDPNCCQTLDYILPICRRVKEAGMDLLLDFHYTDFWADPYHQWTPEDWKYLDDNGLANKLYEYTRESLISDS
ncbi:MAG: arabinogalactan endo-1,4-beta-galactosidase [Muribaculaceae bacterium]|nr:arabinogalactan endo-1,4-beta-galactosidase [Muribaculaceae bacterium]